MEADMNPVTEYTVARFDADALLQRFIEWYGNDLPRSLLVGGCHSAWYTFQVDKGTHERSAAFRIRKEIMNLKKDERHMADYQTDRISEGEMLYVIWRGQE